jgi:uncharacterized protein
MRVEQLRGIEDVDRETWRALEPPEFPFFDFEFLHALERSGSIGRRNGWSPAYLVCREGGRVLGALCVYLKTDSYGEYIFDWEWARAYQQYGLSYYPKLVAAVPFTPATGPKLLLRPEGDVTTRARVTNALLEAAEDLGTEYGVSSSTSSRSEASRLDTRSSFTGATGATRRFRTTWRRSRGSGGVRSCASDATSRVRPWRSHTSQERHSSPNTPH